MNFKKTIFPVFLTTLVAVSASNAMDVKKSHPFPYFQATKQEVINESAVFAVCKKEHRSLLKAEDKVEYCPAIENYIRCKYNDGTFPVAIKKDLKNVAAHAFGYITVLPLFKHGECDLEKHKAEESIKQLTWAAYVLPEYRSYLPQGSKPAQNLQKMDACQPNVGLYTRDVSHAKRKLLEEAYKNEATLIQKFVDLHTTFGVKP